MSEIDFQKISKEYRPIPFWSWNDKLELTETKEQIEKMHLAGMGGFFMHARGGLQTEYMGEEWFENVSASVDEAKKYGMRPWAYDENGWPSGFGNGAVTEMGLEYQQKYLRMEETRVHTEHAICKSGEHYFYFDVNPFYVDTLDKKVTAKFIETTYEPYYERYGTQIEGFFTDEPQISRSGIPWSFVFEEEYRKRYDENILEHLEELYLPTGDYRHTRLKFWKMVTELFSESYMKQLYDWCEERSLKLTGHLLLEDHLLDQLITNGACMPHYEYLHIPGMDWLGREVRCCPTPLQVSSAAEQLGKEAVLSETFALCGHNVSFAKLKGIYEWQMVHGVNLLCQHLEGYSLRGIRKRDYPPAMYIQQPWWQEYGYFNEAMARIGKVLRDGKHPVEILVLHPQSTAWSLYDDRDGSPIVALHEKFMKTVQIMEEKHLEFHLGDEILMERHGSVENGRLVIGNCSYSCVVDPGCEILFEHTEQLLEKFQKQGGQIVTAEELLASDVTDNPRITYTHRVYEDFQIHYFVNTSENQETAEIALRGRKMDLMSGELSAFDGTHEFEPWGSLLIVEDASGDEPEAAVPETLIYPEDRLLLLEGNENCLTLDKCDYYFDGELQEKNGYVLNIAERANALERRVQIHQDYHVKLLTVPKQLFLVCETPENFLITVNGRHVEQKTQGYFADKSFRKIEITDHLQEGENVISFDCDFVQSPEFYQSLRNARIFESEKNKLAYDMEIEAVYLLGDFQVRTDGVWTEMERFAVRYHGDFVLDAPQRELCRHHIEKQGYPFFCGRLKLEGKLKIHGENPVLQIERRGVNAVLVEINGMERLMLTSDKLSLKEFGVQGEVSVKYTLVNNLRNLLGPHHLEIGESYLVCPHSFFKEACMWNEHPEPDWNEDYCFVEMGI